VCERVIIINRGSITADQSTADLRRGIAYSVVARAAEDVGAGLQRMELVKSCEAAPGADVPEGYARFTVVLHEDAPEKLFAALAASSWEVRELAPVARSLQ